MAEAPLRKEDIIYHWCKGEGRYTTMGPHLARIYVAMYYDDTPLLSLSNFCQLTDPIRFDWCMYLLHGIRNNTVRVAKARADELAELYKISLAAHKDEPKLSVSSSVVATVDSSRANKPALELELEPTTPGRRAAASPRVVSSAPSISQPMRSERVMAHEPEPLPDPVFSSGARKANPATPETPPTIAPTAAIAAATADNTPSSSQRPATRKPVAAEVLDDPQPLIIVIIAIRLSHSRCRRFRWKSWSKAAAYPACTRRSVSGGSTSKTAPTSRCCRAVTTKTAIWTAPRACC